MNRVSKEQLDTLRNTYTKGKRVKLVKMNDEPNVITGLMGPGSRGTVNHVDDVGNVHISWDCGSSIAALYGEDVICLLSEKEELIAKTKASLEEVIENMKTNKTINLIEYVIARDVLWESTENNSLISEDNNVGQSFIDHPEILLEGLRNACAAFKEEYPEADNWDYDEINNCSSDYADYCF